MALQHRITELKGKGKYLIENTRYKIRQYRLTRGSGRTEQIFGLSLTTKLLVSVVLLLVVAALFFGAKTFMQNRAADAVQPEPETEEKVVENEVTAPPREPSAPVEEPLVEQQDQPSPAPESPPSPSSSPSFLVDDDEVAEATPLAVLPESIDVQNMGAACQVDIRDKENDLAGASQFFQEAQRSYQTALDAVREPADRLREAMEELKLKKAALETKAQKCDAGVEETPPPAPAEPSNESVPELVPIEPSEDPAENPENQTTAPNQTNTSS